MKPPIQPPPLAIVENHSPLPTLKVTESPPAPTENARPPIVVTKEYVATQDTDNDWFLVVSENTVLRHLTENEAKQIASIMNEQGSNIITLYCRTENCIHRSTWIRRASDDAKKNVYFCEGCKQPMVK